MTDNRELDGSIKYDLDFDEAMERLAQPKPDEVSEITQAEVTADSIDQLIAAFREAVQKADAGYEF